MNQIKYYKLVPNYQDVCRTCLRETNDLKSIFTRSNLRNKTFAQLLTACTSLKILETDKISLKICPSCMEQIDSHYTFAEKSLEADFLLQSSYNFYNVSQENLNQIETKTLIIKGNEIFKNESKNDINDSDSSNILETKNVQTDTKPPDFNGNNEISCTENENEEFYLSVEDEPDVPCGQLSPYILIKLEDSEDDENIVDKDPKSHLEEDIENENKVFDTQIEDGNEFICEQLSSDIYTKLEDENDNFVNKSTIKSIKNEIEEKTESNSIKTENIEIFQCDICMKNWISQQHLEKHLEIHRKHNFKCDICGSTYEAARHLRQHTILVHKDDSEYVCEFCNKIFFMKLQYQQHRLIHSTRKKYICDECGVIVTDVTSLKSHKSIHQGNKKYSQCQICGAKITTHNYTRHMLSHDSAKKHKCKKCGQEFVKKPSLEKHEVTCNKGLIRRYVDSPRTKVQNEAAPAYKCSDCSKSYANYYSFRYHFRQKHGISQSKSKEELSEGHKCVECKRTFRFVWSLRQHARTHSVPLDNPDNTNESGSSAHTYQCPEKDSEASKKSIQCQQCGKMFTRPSQLNRHMLVHTGTKPFKCSYCEKSFRQAAHLHRHELIHLGVKPYKCSYCEKSFRQTAHLYIHERIHLGLKPKNWVNQKTGKELLEEHKCTECNRTFRFAWLLKRHKDLHSVTLDTTCKICELTFQTYHELRRHRKTSHEKDSQASKKSIQCQQCGKMFKSSSHLERHMLVHTGAKPFKCSYCEKSFRQAAHLYRHELIHLGLKPYKCIYCSKGFVEKSNLIEHNQRHLGDKPFKCPVCDKGFYRSDYMKRHLLTHNPGD